MGRVGWSTGALEQCQACSAAAVQKITMSPQCCPAQQHGEETSKARNYPRRQPTIKENGSNDRLKFLVAAVAEQRLGKN